MSKRYFNWKLAIVLILGFAVLAVSVFFLRRWQIGKRTESALDLGLKAYEEMQWDAAAENLGRFVAVERDNCDILLQYGYAQLHIRPLRAENIQQAISSYRALLRLDPANIEAARKLGQTYLEMGASGEAELIASRHMPSDIDTELSRILVFALLNQRKFTEAAEQLNKHIESKPNDVLAYEVMGLVTAGRQEFSSKKAIEWFDEAVSVNGESALSFICRADYKLARGEKDSAIKDIDRACNLNLENTISEQRLVISLIRLRMFEQAEKRLRAMNAKRSDDAEIWHIWAMLAMEAGKKGKMVEVAKQGLGALSSYPWSFMETAAELFIAGNDLDNAEKCISNLEERGFSAKSIAYMRGLLEYARDDYGGANRYWREAAKLGYDSPDFRLKYADACRLVGDYTFAKAEIDRVIGANADRAEGFEVLGRIYFDTSNWQGCIECAEKVLTMEPGNYWAYFNLIQAKMQIMESPLSGEDIEFLNGSDSELNKVAEADGSWFERQILRTQIKLKLGEYGEAWEILNELKRDYSDDIRLVLAEADIVAVADEKDNEDILKKGLDKFGYDPRLVKSYAAVLEENGRCGECVEIMREAFENASSEKDQRNMAILLSGYYFQQNEVRLGCDVLQDAAERLPRDIIIKRKLLLCDDIIADSAAAQKLIDEIREIEGEDGHRWRFEQAKVWMRSADFKEYSTQIIALLKKNLLINPDDQASREMLGLAYLKKGDIQLAISTYTEALDRSPDDEQLIVSLVDILYQARKYSEASELVDRLPVDSNDSPAIATLKLRKYLHAGEYDKAESTLKKLIEKDPNNTGALFALANLKLQQKEYAQSCAILEKIYAEDSNSVYAANALVRVYLESGDSLRARSFCDEFVDKVESSQSHLLRARALVYLGDDREALDDFNNAVSSDSNNVEALLSRADYFRSKGQIISAAGDMDAALEKTDELSVCKKAILVYMACREAKRSVQACELIDRCLSEEPEDIQFNLLKAKILLRNPNSRNIALALSLLENISDTGNSEPGYWATMSAIEMASRHTSVALDYAMRGLAHWPENKALLLMKAEAEAANFPALAIPTVKQICEMDANDIDSANKLAGLYVQANDFNSAIDVLKRQISKCNRSEDVCRCSINLALTLYEKGDKAEGRALLSKTARQFGNRSEVLIGQVKIWLGELKYEEIKTNVIVWQGEHREDWQTVNEIVNILMKSDMRSTMSAEIAEIILKENVRLNPANVDCMHVYGSLLQLDKRNSEACKIYWTILKVNPDDVVAMNNLAWILADEKNEYQNALVIADKAVELSPNYADLLDTRGVINYKLGNFNQAIDDLKRCVSLYSEMTSFHTASCFHLGQTYVMTANKAKAEEYLSLAVKNNLRTGGLSQANLGQAERLLSQLSSE